MKRTLCTSIAVLIAGLAIALATARAEEPTRESFVAQAEPICEHNVVLSQRILKGAKSKIDNDRLPQAGEQFSRASTAFADAIRQLVAIPRPPADNERLLKWFKVLRIVKTRLADIGKALKEEDEIKANHERIRAERSGNAANNVGFVFGFNSCRITRSQFRN
jgi:hypothetical protein